MAVPLLGSRTALVLTKPAQRQQRPNKTVLLDYPQSRSTAPKMLSKLEHSQQDVQAAQA